jgi:hypothetical protein
VLIPAVCPECDRCITVEHSFDGLRDALVRLDADAQRWLTESDDRPNLRAAAARIRELLELLPAGES